MNPVSIRSITVADVQAAPGIDALLAEYARESANEGMGHAVPQWPIYQAMEAAGFCHVLGAECEGKLIGLLVLNYLKSLSEPQLFALRRELSEADYKHFVGERSKLVTGQASNGPGDLNSSAIKSTLDARLRELKIDPTPKDDGGNDSARVGAIRRYVDEKIGAMQRDAGKKFNDTETAAAIEKLFSNSAQLKGWTSYSAPAISAKPGDIPKATQDQIRAAFKKQGVDEPTDAQLLNAFLHLNSRKK